MKVLDQVKCHGATGGTGINGRTKIRVSMHAWNGDRGTYIARKLRHLFAEGCNVKVMWALAGSGMKRVIGMKTHRGEIRRHADGYNTDCDELNQVDKYSHQKYMTISGHYGKDHSTSLVLTGSSNWTHSGVVGDEIILRARASASSRTGTATSTTSGPSARVRSAAARAASTPRSRRARPAGRPRPHGWRPSRSCPSPARTGRTTDRPRTPA